MYIYIYVYTYICIYIYNYIYIYLYIYIDNRNSGCLGGAIGRNFKPSSGHPLELCRFCHQARYVLSWLLASLSEPGFAVYVILSCLSSATRKSRTPALKVSFWYPQKEDSVIGICSGAVPPSMETTMCCQQDAVDGLVTLNWLYHQRLRFPAA